MDDDNEQSRAFSPYFRIWLCGAFRVERRVGTTYEVIRTTEWGGSSYPRLLLKALLCCPGRQARREALSELLWPETDPEQAAHYLNTATTKLRAVLRPGQGHESLLLTEEDSKHYLLEGQPLVWVDAEAALALLKEAERMGRDSREALPFLEEVATYFQRGTFLDGEEGLWASGKRATIERAGYRCRLWLAEAYEQQGMIGQAEMVLSTLLEEDPTDEDALCRLMELLHQQGMTHQALHVYKQTCAAFAQEGMELTEATRRLASQLEKERQHPLQGGSDSVRMMSSAGYLPSLTLPILNTAVGNLPHSILLLPSIGIVAGHPTEAMLLDCAICFGVQLAQMMALVHQWYGMAAFCNELQNRLDGEIKRLDRMTKQYPLEEYMLSRRSLLTTLAALPVSHIVSVQQKHKVVFALEELLPTCAASIAACWHLSGGSRSDLDVILPILDSYLPILISTCKHTPVYREVAADLVAQIYFLKAILSWHVDGLESAEAYCIQAMKYSDLTKNINLRLAGLNQHAVIAYYGKDFQKALVKAQEADATLRQASHEHIFPIIMGRVSMFLAAIQAQQQLKDAECTLERAQVAFATQSATIESVPIYADCGNASLLLWDGLTHYYLGPRSAEHATRASTSLSTFGRLASSTTIPERFRLECLNSRILAAIQLGELEEAITCLEAGQHGAKALGSKQRNAEIDYAYQLICERWPSEERVKKLRGQTVE